MDWSNKFFPFDESFEPYVTPDEICNYFKTKKLTVGEESKKNQKYV